MDSEGKLKKVEGERKGKIKGGRSSLADEVILVSPSYMNFCL
jgi:hypothetical protein